MGHHRAISVLRGNIRALAVHEPRQMARRIVFGSCYDRNVSVRGLRLFRFHEFIRTVGRIEMDDRSTVSDPGGRDFGRFSGNHHVGLRVRRLVDESDSTLFRHPDPGSHATAIRRCGRLHVHGRHRGICRHIGGDVFAAQQFVIVDLSSTGHAHASRKLGASRHRSIDINS